MSFLRTTSRALIAGIFIYDGIDAIVHTDKHVKSFREIEPKLEKIGVPPILESDAKAAARISGAATALCGTALALGFFPRTAATLLAIANAPISCVQYPLLVAKDKRNQNLKGFALRMAVTGGLIMAAFDREGQPSLGWRYHNWKALRTSQTRTTGDVID